MLRCIWMEYRNAQTQMNEIQIHMKECWDVHEWNAEIYEGILRCIWMEYRSAQTQMLRNADIYEGMLRHTWTACRYIWIECRHIWRNAQIYMSGIQEGAGTYERNAYIRKNAETSMNGTQTYMKEFSDIYGWNTGMRRHIWTECRYIWKNAETYMNEIQTYMKECSGILRDLWMDCGKCEWVLRHMWLHHVPRCMGRKCSVVVIHEHPNVHERVLQHIQMSSSTYLNESSNIYECVVRYP